MRKLTAYITLFCCICFSSLLHANNIGANDLGKWGHVYPIIEQDLLAMIKQKLLRMQKDGSLDRLNRKMQSKLTASVNRPKPVSHIGITQERRSWLYDPSIKSTTELKDHLGRVFVNKGTVVNPLDYVSLSKTLLFINADIKEQLDWALEIDKRSQNPVVIIFTSGEVFPLMKQHQKRFYFDQHGTITKKLNIQHVPAFVIQEGKKLRITEEVI